MAKKEIP